MFQHLKSQLAKQHAADLKVGDIVVVSGHKASVLAIWYDDETARTQIDLSFGEFGKAKVYAHDEHKTWTRLSNFN